MIIDRFPETDYKDIPFTENAEFVMKIVRSEYGSFAFRKVRELSIEKWKDGNPIFLHSASHNRGRANGVLFYRDGSQNYGTSLVFYEKLSMHRVYLFMNHRNKWS